jgi:hypothetical protein
MVPPTGTVLMSSQVIGSVSAWTDGAAHATHTQASAGQHAERIEDIGSLRCLTCGIASLLWVGVAPLGTVVIDPADGALEFLTKDVFSAQTLASGLVLHDAAR